MIREAEEFAADDEQQRKRIEALNSLSSFVYGLKNQLTDQEGLGGKISEDDKKTLLATIKDTTDWIDDNGQSASVEDLEEKLTGVYSFRTRRCAVLTQMSSEVQGVVTPITSKLYGGGGKPASGGDEEDAPDHDEL